MKRRRQKNQEKKKEVGKKREKGIKIVSEEIQIRKFSIYTYEPV
jgi:transcriptional antiterminator